jgi:hypothetical protein
VYSPESLALYWVRSQVTDQRGVSGFVAKLFDRSLIIPHRLAFSGCWAVSSKLLLRPAVASACSALRSSSTFSAGRKMRREFARRFGKCRKAILQRQ